MPTIKHPCPHCGKWIQRDVRACPFCGTADPFAPGRCPSCRSVIEDPAWVACPACGASLVAKPAGAEGAAPRKAATPGPPSAPPAEAPAATGATRTCAGCGAPLAAAARFCTICGTLAEPA